MEQKIKRETFCEEFKLMFDKYIAMKLPDEDLERRFMVTVILLLSHISNASIPNKDNG